MIRRSLYTFGFIASLMVTTSAVQARTLAPASDWSVNKVAVAQGDAYCTLARQYEGNSVMTFARNAAGEGTIALDFQRDVFDVTRPYPITLQAGNVIRQYVIKPANNSAIIMRTSTDASLFEAMRDTGGLKVQIDTEDFTVDLGGYRDGFAKLISCTGGDAVVKMADRDEVPRPPKGIENQVTAQDSLGRQDAEIDALLRDNATLVKTLEDERADFRRKLAEDRVQNSADTQSSVATLDTAVMEKLVAAEKRNADLLRRVTMLESQLATKTATLNPDLPSALQERDSQIALLKGERQRLEDMLDEERRKRVALEAEVVALKAQKGDAGMMAQGNALAAELEKQVASLTQQNESLRSQLETARNTEPQVVVKEIIKEVPVMASATPAAVQDLNIKLAEAETEALSYKAERDEYRNLLQKERQRLKEMSDLGQQVSTTSAQSDNMVAAIRKLEAEKVDLIRQLEYAKAGGIAPGRVDTSANADMQKRLESVMQESEEAKQKLRLLAADKSALEIRLREAEMAAADAKRVLASAKTDQIAGDRESSEIKSLESEIASLEAQNRVLREDLAARASRVDVDRTGSKDMIAALEEKYSKRLEVIENENVRLTRELQQERNKEPQIVEKIVEVDFDNPQMPSSTAVAPQVGNVAMVTETKTVAPNEARRQLRNKITGKPVAPMPAPIAANVHTRHAVPIVTPVVESGQDARVVRPQPPMLSGDDIRTLVMRAQIPLETPIERVSTISGPDFAAFRWDTGRVYGSGEESRLSSPQAFEQAVADYMRKTENRCQGDFDKTIIPVAAPNGMSARAADIACIQNDSSDGAAASVVFFAHNGMFYALAHETDLDGFEIAMDNRDRLVKTLPQVF